MAENEHSDKQHSRLKRHYKLREGWSIIGRQGLYYAFSPTRKDAIAEHCLALGKSWKYCHDKGDRAIRTAIFSVRP